MLQSRAIWPTSLTKGMKARSNCFEYEAFYTPHYAPIYLIKSLAGSKPLCLKQCCRGLSRHKLQNSRWIQVWLQKRTAAFLQRVSCAALELFCDTSHTIGQEPLANVRCEDHGLCFFELFSEWDVTHYLADRSLRFNFNSRFSLCFYATFVTFLIDTVSNDRNCTRIWTT